MTRQDDGLGWAYGLRGSVPKTVWERFSTAYEAQAEEVLTELREMGYEARLDWAGGQDGEAALALRDDELVLVLHLEDPVEAELIEKSRKAGALRDHLNALI